MLYPVCVKCQREMLNQRTVLIVEHSNQGFYKLWHGNLMECPECHSCVLDRWGSAPSQTEADPARMMLEYNYNLQRHIADIFHVFESKAQRLRWEKSPAFHQEDSLRRAWLARDFTPAAIPGTEGQDRENYTDTQD